MFIIERLMWTKAAVAELMTLSRHFPGGNEENMKSLGKDIRYMKLILTTRL